MVWPAGDFQWTTEGGVAPLQPPGQSAEYKPAMPGAADYRLVVASGPIKVPTGPVDLEKVDALGEAAWLTPTFTIDWKAP